MPTPPQVPGYRIERQLGAGGMGAVYLAVAPTGERVAIKTVLGTFDVEEPQRFRREAQLLAELEHTGILRVLDHGVADGRPYLITEFVPGDSLQDHVIRQGPLNPERAAVLGRALADALGYAHQRGVIHRDLKPHNVMLRADGSPVLIDFGLVKPLSSDATKLTETGALMGSPGYMAPEQARGEAVGPPADLYALGGVLFFCLSGRPPFQGRTALETLTQVVHAPSPEVEGPTWLAGPILRCLQKSPEARFPSAWSLAQALEPPPKPTPASRERGWTATAGLTVAALLGAVSLLLLVDQDGPPPAEPRQAAVVTSSTSPTEPAELADPRLDEARRLLREDPAACVALLERMDSPDPEVLRVRVQGLFLLDRLPEAYDVACRARDRAPARAQLHALVGDACLRLGRREEALTSYDRTLELDPSLVYSWINRGMLRLQRGDPAGALEDLTRAVELDPSERFAVTSLVGTQRELGKFDDAAETPRRALDRAHAAGDRRSEAAYALELGELQLSRGRPTSALAAYRAAHAAFTAAGAPESDLLRAARGIEAANAAQR